MKDLKKTNIVVLLFLLGCSSQSENVTLNDSAIGQASNSHGSKVPAGDAPNGSASNDILDGSQEVVYKEVQVNSKSYYLASRISKLTIPAENIETLRVEADVREEVIGDMTNSNAIYFSANLAGIGTTKEHALEDLNSVKFESKATGQFREFKLAHRTEDLELLGIKVLSSDEYINIKTPNYSLKKVILISTGGNIKVDHLNSNGDITTTSIWDISLTNSVGTFAAKAERGNIATENCSGEFDLKTGSIADIKAKHLQGSVTARAERGNITVEDAAGNLNLKTGSIADIEATGIKGNLQAECERGNIKVDGEISKVALSTGSIADIQASFRGNTCIAGSMRGERGAINASFQSTVSTNINCKTERGVCTNKDLPLKNLIKEDHHLAGALNNGNCNLLISTGSIGDVILNSL